MRNFILFLMIFILVTVFSCTRKDTSETTETSTIIEKDEISKLLDANEPKDDNIISHIYVETSALTDYRWSIRITENQMIYHDVIDDPESPVNEFRLLDTYEKYDIIQEIVDDMLYINFYYDGEFLVQSIKVNGKWVSINADHGQKRYLVLYEDGNLIYFYDDTNTCVWRFSSAYHTSSTFSPSRWEYISEIGSIVSTSSELKEGNKIYSSDNLLDKFLLEPWATENGIGEIIVFLAEDSRFNNSIYDSIDNTVRFNGISISNGFVDYNKPYLYKYNNRVKKIRISRGDLDEYVDFELNDTPQLQYLHFRDELKGEQEFLVIEILEVYNGTRYDDTCINFIIPRGESLKDYQLYTENQTKSGGRENNG